MAPDTQASLETVETGDAARTPPVKRGRRLGNVANVRSGLADVIRQLEAGELETKRANALVYAYSVLAGIMQGSDLEARVAALEESGA
mgnify:CR=1 FL=1